MILELNFFFLHGATSLSALACPAHTGWRIRRVGSMTARARPGCPGVARHGSEERGAGGGRARDTVCLSRTTSVSDSTRRRSGQERPQPGIGGRSRHDASRSTSSASRGVTCDLLSLSLSERLCLSCLCPSLSLSRARARARPTSRILRAPVCVSVVCAAPPACPGVLSKRNVSAARGRAQSRI